MGQLVLDDRGGAVLVGAIKQPDLPALVAIAGGLLAAFIALVGAATLLAGDTAGIVSLAFATITAGAVLGSYRTIRRLSTIDEQTIKTALRAISASPDSIDPRAAGYTASDDPDRRATSTGEGGSDRVETGSKL
jgi:hypothetical protein